jgi:hypothetical protein
VPAHEHKLRRGQHVAEASFQFRAAEAEERPGVLT